MSDTVTRMSADEVAAADSVQGWALSDHPERGDGRRPVDLLFLHGMAGGGWIWPRSWLRQFRDEGYRCHVLSLPGRDGGQTLASDPDALDRALSLALSGRDPERALDLLGRALPGAALFDGPDLEDFTDSLAEALSRIGRPVVVVGHSLGGAVAQSLIRRGGAPAGTVLLCSVPPYGMWRASMQMALLNPSLWRNLARFSLFGADHADMTVMRDNLFPGGIDGQSFAALQGRLRDESLAAMLQAGGFPPFAPLPGPRGDVMVIGGARDRFVPALDAMLTGLWYGGAARLLPGAGHMPMQEPESQTALAAMMLGWLEQFGAATAEAA